MNKYKTFVMKAYHDGVAVLKLDKAKMASIASDPSATKAGIVILVVPFLLNAILSGVLAGGFFFLYFRILLVSALMSFGAIFVLGLVAQQVFHAKMNLVGFFRVVSHAGILMILTVVPFILGLFGSMNVFNLFNLISMAAGIWTLIVVYNVLLQYFKLSAQNAVITMVIGVVILAILQAVIGRVVVGPFYGFVY